MGRRSGFFAMVSVTSGDKAVLDIMLQAFLKAAQSGTEPSHRVREALIHMALALRIGIFNSSLQDRYVLHSEAMHKGWGSQGPCCNIVAFCVQFYYAFFLSIFNACLSILWNHNAHASWNRYIHGGKARRVSLWAHLLFVCCCASHQL